MSGFGRVVLVDVLAPLLRRWPLYRGQMRIAGLEAVRRLAVGAGPECEARLAGGRVVRIDPRDFDGRMLLLFGSVDPKVLAVCRALIRPGDSFLDIGANYGAVGMSLAGAVGADGAVHLFEPQPDLCRRIRQSLEQQPEPRVALHEIALFDRDGLLELLVPTGHSGGASVVRPGEGERLLVKVRKTESVLAELPGNRPLGAKVDVEGAENTVLGALVGHPEFRFVVFEASHLENPAEICGLARRHGGTLLGVGRSPVRPLLHRVRTAEELGEFEDAVIVAAGVLCGGPQDLDPAERCTGPGGLGDVRDRPTRAA